MKHLPKIAVILILPIVLFIIKSCKELTPPVVTTLNVSGVTQTSAISGGNVKDDGGAVVSERGVCWSTNQNPTTDNDKTSDGSGTGSFTTSIKCLSFATTYYVRAYATNSAGTAYGDQVSFTTKGTNPIIFKPDLTYGSVTDIDGNCYKTIQIADRIWMAENLRTSRYNDGVSIPNVTDDNEWHNLVVEDFPFYEISGAYCWYNNDSAAYKNGFGKLYNFGAVQTGKLCPIGWHVPGLYEIKIVDSYPDCENYSDIGWNLIETGSTHWVSSTAECPKNGTGFTALPGGLRKNYGTFSCIGRSGWFWSSHTNHTLFATFNMIPHEDYFFMLGDLCRTTKGDGLSVRCVKDN